MTGWQGDKVKGNAQSVRSILTADPIWAAYAIADLQPAFAPHCRWLVDEEGLVLLFDGLTPTVLMSVGSPTALATVLTEAAEPLPDQVYLSIREEHEAVIGQFYDNSADRRLMVRMALPAVVTLPPTDPDAVRLTVDDAPRLRQLYTHGGPFTPDAFDPYQLDGGIFFGLADETGALAAVGGTHIVNRGEGVAAIGNIYTRPDCRGRGYARRITAAIVNAAQADGITNLVLNVDTRNHVARSLYESLGFVVHCSFVEGVAERNA